MIYILENSVKVTVKVILKKKLKRKSNRAPELDAVKGPNNLTEKSHLLIKDP